jgi:hypothetical protein
MPGIIAAESPNPIVNDLVIMPDIEKRTVNRAGPHARQNPDIDDVGRGTKGGRESIRPVRIPAGSSLRAACPAAI